MNRKLVAILLLSLVLRVLLIGQTPFFRDEALYAETIDEMIQSGNPVPHYAGAVAPWKPPLTFWFYSSFVFAMNPLGMPPEILYRLPSAFLGALCTVVVYFLVKELSEDEDLALISSLIYAAIPLSITTNRMLLTDSLLSLLMLCSLLFFLRARRDSKLALLGGLFIGLAILTKSIAALFAPGLVVLFYLLYKREMLRDKFFLLSLAFIPVSFILLIQFPGMGAQLAVDVTSRAASQDVLNTFLINLLTLLALAMPWLALAVYGAYRYGSSLKNCGFWAAWLLAGLFPLFTNGPLFWYFLPLMVPVSIFSAKTILAGGRADKFSTGFALVLVFFSAAIAYMFIFLSPGLVEVSNSDGAQLVVASLSSQRLYDEREMGYYLQDKDALLLAIYSPTAMYYKFRGNGDFGSLDAFFITNDTKLEEPEAMGIIVNGNKPGSSLDIYEAIVASPYVPQRMHLGKFDEPRDFIVIERQFYEKFMAGREDYSGFEKMKENRYFIVLERKT